MTTSQIAARKKRLAWFTDARLGMFIHYGLYSQLGRHEWVMNRERIPPREYQKFAETFAPRPGAPRAWAKLAKSAGMKYMVLTTKHHEGFCLWDSKVNPFCAGRRGPKRDIVAEYVDACRAEGLRIGFYYSLMDWHHADGLRCRRSEPARRRFLDYTQALVAELMTGYGKVDILWYDIPLPLETPEAWESAKMNAMARSYQPEILINARSYLPEDFDQSEENIRPSAPGRAWECCLTTADGWGYMDTPPEDWMSTRKMLSRLREVLAGDGNLLLNIGPEPDGKLPPEGVKRFTDFGRWVKTYAEAIYGQADRVEKMEGTFCGQWTRKGRTYYYWVTHWPGEEMAIGGLRGKVKRVSLMPSGKALRFRQEPDRIIVRGLPARCPDKVCNIGMLKFEFATKPTQRLGPCMKVI